MSPPSLDRICLCGWLDVRHRPGLCPKVEVESTAVCSPPLDENPTCQTTSRSKPAVHRFISLIVTTVLVTAYLPAANSAPPDRGIRDQYILVNLNKSELRSESLQRIAALRSSDTTAPRLGVGIIVSYLRHSADKSMALLRKALRLRHSKAFAAHWPNRCYKLSVRAFFTLLYVFGVAGVERSDHPVALGARKASTPTTHWLRRCER
jgi:hypothetical protein